MKNLICASEYYPYGSGIANVAYNVVEQLKKMGVDCTVCSPTGPDIKLGSSKLIEKTGIIGLLYYWHQVAKYFKRQENNFDVVWIHNPLFLKRNPFQRSIITLHSTYYGKMVQRLNPKMYYKITSRIERYCLNKMDWKTKFTGVSTQICKELEKIGINKERIMLILNGVDTEKFKPIADKKVQSELGLENKQIILYVGRLSRVKLVDTVIKSMPFILNEINNMKLLIIGDGPQKNDLINLAKKLDIYKSIIMYDAQPNDKLPVYYSIADVVVCPYAGLVLFEAMSMGKPIVAFDVEWHSEVITNMENGILVENVNIAKLSKAIIKLLGNKELSDKIGSSAREYAFKKLDWNIITKKYLEVFEKVVSNDRY